LITAKGIDENSMDAAKIPKIGHHTGQQRERQEDRKQDSK
jgi:hypothetical protein